MKVKQEIVGEKCVLVPYERHHVEQYHNWMKNPNILELTASEPLSLQEEYDMRDSWENDREKLTFIVLEVNKRKMVGDVNMFFHDYLIENDIEYGVGEVEVMIAEKTARRKGIAIEAVTLILKYAKETLGTRKVVAKVGAGNVPSLNLFRDRLDFDTDGKPNVFNEVALTKCL
eukprot:augustus_masked-scaffold_7-processed-gene-14.52-mRNA-1 protein AED:0.35 eAED:0.35 QI:0/-1/0/1/-1/1/1/0/172